MTRSQGVAALVGTVAMALLIAALSQWPIRDASDHAIVRLSWRTDPIRVETCRELTPEEQEGVPAHMRRAEECTGYHADYELSLRIDDVPTVLDTVSPSGLREDRPVYVLAEAPVLPGLHRVEVSFAALVPDDMELGDQTLRLDWDGELTLDARQIGLLTLDASGTRIVRVSAPDGP